MKCSVWFALVAALARSAPGAWAAAAAKQTCAADHGAVRGSAMLQRDAKLSHQMVREDEDAAVADA
eukprot:CAMPEP_0179134498 /NCGR_PEP_ID=MMETSP0796-20121207/64002_1 /TAXON_ID=73915 /ORGANISM="Pyrodinium bahamense, Strain pbaha01" /LENGTH=65 /DNA_ID=CAMNT_0020833493 /DNA_START=58 /DNA_END=251 /DNA_ORIENTATION=+